MLAVKILFCGGAALVLISFILMMKAIVNKNMDKMFKWLVILNIGNIIIQVCNLILQLNK